MVSKETKLSNSWICQVSESFSAPNNVKQDNPLGDEGVKIIAEALSHNSTLKDLDLLSLK